MLTIGLTGNIGSGKSTVGRYLASVGAIIIDADQVARSIVEPDTPALTEIVRFYGQDILDDFGKLDRKKLGSLVFANPDAMSTLNTITHPRIVEAIKQERLKHSGQSALCDKLLVIDAPLLIEVGLHKDLDEIWVVQIDAQKQIQRLMERDGLCESEARNRVNAQMPQEEKLKYAHRIIYNSGTLEDTIKQIKHHLNGLRKRV